VVAARMALVKGSNRGHGVNKGQYDDICESICQQVAIDRVGGGVLVVVIGGDRGSGFSCHSDFASILHMPRLLEQIADKIRHQLEETPT
jgi:hypothetical protein